MEEVQRIAYMDIAKAFAIIAVVIGHSGSPVTHIIYLYHMPLFFFLSGYFYKDMYSKSPVTLLKKRLKSLYIPFVAWELLFLLLHNVFFKLSMYSDKVGYGTTGSHLYTTKEFIINAAKIIAFIGTEQLAGAFWFILSLFTVNILFVLTSYFSTKYIKNSEYFRFLVVFLAFTIGNIATYYGFNLHYQLNISFVALFIYYIGYLYRKIERRIDFNSYLLVISFLSLIISSLYGSIDMVNNKYLSPSFLIFNSLAGIYLNIYFAKKIISYKMNYTLLDYIGKNTFTIMALHLLSFKLINIIQVNMYNLPFYMVAKFPVIDGANGWWLLYSACGLFLPIGVKYTVDMFTPKIQRMTYHLYYFR
jgi:Fucose 4-O-acetylase and related acetyltransferases